MWASRLPSRPRRKRLCSPNFATALRTLRAVAKPNDVQLTPAKRRDRSPDLRSPQAPSGTSRHKAEASSEFAEPESRHETTAELEHAQSTTPIEDPEFAESTSEISRHVNKRDERRAPFVWLSQKSRRERSIIDEDF
jgi:hypothetical protein